LKPDAVRSDLRVCASGEPESEPEGPWSQTKPGCSGNRKKALKAGEGEAKLKWDADRTEQVKACLPEEPEPEPGG
jgi:hypothetical protein